jgi:hypothetical protein
MQFQISGTPNSLTVFNQVPAAQSLVFCVVFWKLLLVIMFFFLLVIALPVLLFTVPGYSFGIFKLSLLICLNVK